MISLEENRIVDRQTVTKRILFIGDIVAGAGRGIVERNLRRLQQDLNIDFTIANGENSAHGFGMSKKTYLELSSFGIDAFTLGNHSWDNREIFSFLEQTQNIIRPANMEGNFPGQGCRIFELGEMKLAIINLLGQIYMSPAGCPFAQMNRLLEALSGKATNIIVDMHAEATSEKMALGWYLDGKVSAVLGTHTHIQTNDARILPKGTAYITDVGMTGPRDSVLGMDRELVLRRFITKKSNRLHPALGDVQFNAVVLDISSDGTAKKIEFCNLVENQF